MIMQTRTKHNIDLHQPADPPIPPPAHFDEHEMAIAKPVQPLPNGHWRKQPAGLRILFFRHVNLICMVIAAFAICGVLANTFAEKSSLEIAKDARTEAVDESTADLPVAEAPSMSPAAGVVGPHDRKMRNRSSLRVRRPMPSWAFETGLDDGRRRPRLVGVIH
jgi:hypothetical protein